MDFLKLPPAPGRGLKPWQKIAPLQGGWGVIIISIFAQLKSEAVESTESTRQKKVARLIQKEVAEIFLRKGNEYAPGKMVSITKVRVSPDLSYSKIYISVFPSANNEEVLNAITSHVHKIRFDLGHKVRSQLRIVPEIAFFIDDSLDYIDKIDKLLKT